MANIYSHLGGQTNEENVSVESDKDVDVEESLERQNHR